MGNILSNTIEKLLFHPVTTAAVEKIANDFQLVSLQGEGLQEVRRIPGQTIQFLVGSLTKRAYTPMDLDRQAGSARFLFYLHGAGPGSAWAASLKEGDVCKLMHPKHSIDFSKAEGAVLFFGDETSLAAAQALQQSLQGRVPHHFVFEVASPTDALILTEKLGLEKTTLLSKRNDGAHIESVVEELMANASRLGSPQWYFTGQARSIQSIRKLLKLAGFSLQKSIVKAYWSPGKTGMD